MHEESGDVEGGERKKTKKVATGGRWIDGPVVISCCCAIFAGK